MNDTSGAIIEVKVPDIGDFKDVEVIEVLVSPGDSVIEEASLITLESDKASMEIPAPRAGIVRSVEVAVGDRISEGTRILTLEVDDAGAAQGAPQASPEPSAAREIVTEVVVLGAGPGGYTAAFRAADLGKKVVLIERYDTLGGVCLNVGCIPSKALLHTAAILEEVKTLGSMGVTFGAPEIDLDKMRAGKEQVVAKLTGGLAAMAKQRRVEVLQGTGRF
jgi:dihydrolipoamide dehydrogenase